MVDPNDKRARLKVVRRGKSVKAVSFKYATVEGIAKKSQQFLSKSEVIRFEVHFSISILFNYNTLMFVLNIA